MYTEAMGTGAVVPNGTTPLAAEDISAAAAVHGEHIVLKAVQIKRLMFVVTTAVVATTTAPVVAFKKRPTPGSTSGSSVIGTLTIPNGTAVGTVLYKDVSPVKLNAGDAICLEHTVQAVGSAAGGGLYGFELIDHPEQPANQSDMLASV